MKREAKTRRKISTFMRKKVTSSHSHWNNSGFSLIEILVALSLVTIMFSLVGSYNFTSRQALEEVAESIERSIRFSVDESTIRSAAVRVRFLLEEDPQAFTVEYGPDSSFVLPSQKYPSRDELSKRELENYLKNNKNLNKKFLRISELQEGNKKIDSTVKLIGVGLVQQQKFIKDFEPSIYFYPSGEKDPAVVFLGTETEVLALYLLPFSGKIERIYRELEMNEFDDLADAQVAMSQTIFEEILK